MRAYELAKKLGLAPKELLAKAKEKGIKIKSSLITLDKDTIAKLQAAFARAKPKPERGKEGAVGSPRALPKSAEGKAKKVPSNPKIEAKEKDVGTMGSLLDKAAAKEKEVRAFRPAELEQAPKMAEVKGRRRFRPPIRKIPIRPKTVFVRPPVIPPKPKKKVEKERRIILEPPVTIKNLSEGLGIKANFIIQKLMGHKVMKSINDTLNEDEIIMVGLEFNYEIELKKPRDLMSEIIKDKEPDRPEDLVPRAPVVVLMGHVDHGKTTLLDRIRTTDVVSGEAGSITQHLGSYQAEVNGRKITFLDTPGHKAFTNMRARGANVTDIAILVVAADDGVMPQTEEAISHARAAKVPIMVAITKIDKKEANIIKAKQQLSNLDLIPEDWGGKTIFVEVSGVTGQGIDHLLEMLVLQADVMELKVNPKKKAQGAVLEVRMDEGKGPLVTGLVQKGTLRIGNVVVCGRTNGKVRAMFDDKFKPIREALPSTPVAFAGLSELPEAGDIFFVVDDLAQAKEITETIRLRGKESASALTPHLTMENIFQRMEQDKIKEVRLIVKVDVNGSLEVLQNVLNNLSAQEVKIKIIHSGVGTITESDVLLADVSDAIIIGFHIQPEERARQLAQEKNIEIKLYEVIYQLTDEIKLALEGMLEPEKVEVVTAHLAVREIFKISRLGTIAGCMVSDGKIERSNLVRVKRDKQIVFDGKINSLKRFKEDVREVAEGFECGLKIEGFNNIQQGNVVEAYRIEKRTRKLQPQSEKT